MEINRTETEFRDCFLLFCFCKIIIWKKSLQEVNINYKSHTSRRELQTDYIFTALMACFYYYGVVRHLYRFSIFTTWTVCVYLFDIDIYCFDVVLWLL